jgi:beta-glucosidase
MLSNYRRRWALRRRLVALTAAVAAMVGIVAGHAPAHGAGPARAAAAAQPWLNRSLSPDQRAQLLLGALTLDEKVALMHGIGDETGQGFVGDHTGAIPPIPRVGFPGMHFTDGPAGVRQHTEAATALPAGVALAATWDTGLARSYGEVLGREARADNNDAIFGPMVNMVRIERSGRDFETLGEDPLLAGKIGVADIQGIQSQGVMATVKHWVANNQETDRQYTDARVDERTLHELYMPAFEAAVKQGDVASVMAAYNRVNGAYNAENCPLQRGVLDGQFGFTGLIVSDYDSTHGSAQDVICGTDVEFPTGSNYQNLPSDVAAGRITVAQIDEAVLRILRAAFRFGVFDRAPCPDVNHCAPIDVAAGAAVARNVAQAGTVLLKNDPVQGAKLLPLDPAQVRSIAVIGPSAGKVAAGGGSSQVPPLEAVTPLQGIQQRAKGAGITVTYDSGGPQAAAVAAAANVAVVVVSDALTEGFDRSCLDLSCGGNFDFQPQDDALIAQVAAANPRTVVVLDSGAPDTMPWLGSVPALVEGWFAGEENGHALAAVLFGDYDPSGRLPVSFPQKDTDVAVTSPTQYPGVAEEAQYSEGVLTGYRHYDASGIQPLFAFGYGLSYTTFAYDHLSARVQGDHALIDFDVTNAGSRAGIETPQVYVGAPPDNSIGEPPKWLRNFTKVQLAPGQTGHVSLPLVTRDISYWDTSRHQWAVQPGCHPVLVGASSQDIRLRGVTIGDGPSCTVTLPGAAAAAPAALPQSLACASRRDFAIHLPHGLRSATIYVNGHRVRVLTGRRLRSRVDLRGLPRGRFTVRIVARTRAGRKVVSSRRYRTCTRRRPRGKRHR